MAQGGDVVIVDGEIMIVDLDSVVTAALELREEELVRTSFVRAIAGGVPASEAYLDIWHSRR